ncbi:hypothetical protein GCM10008955_32840 [Deinococcus malanensis]|uniref:Uncharacterized protein n=1 Tax=Deinococcus malanensis TaxID=1706855 RepID=A0ABQ2F3B2_9DEIO|nr:hypothetical protein [Deinococcus malanensis]GGK36443.1 hypothetical protein GCM10008955_32840 [Deinococcus malanensis]
MRTLLTLLTLTGTAAATPPLLKALLAVTERSLNICASLQATGRR